ncbi:MAG TPA: hypothetical protein DEO94_07375 [Cyanobacteria bacterium UBA11991]|nr:hypothetical protein [Cyanobacteria bacterium UBA11991]
MSGTQKLAENAKKVLISIGKNNKPIYAMMAIAVANGIFKPLSSLTDKKAKPEEKKYAALREFMTECVAVPTYWACGTGAAVLGSKLYKDNPAKKELARTNMMFLGVCVAALAVIPAVCSGAMRVLDIALGKHKKDSKEPAAQIDVTSKAPEMNVYNKDNNAVPKFGNTTLYNMNTFANRGGLKI